MLCSMDTVILKSDGCIWQLFKILVSHGAKFTSVFFCNCARLY